MPDESKRETILVAIKTTLEGIKKADGYWHTVEADSVLRRAENFSTLSPAELPALVIQSGVATMVNNVSGLISWMWPIIIYGAIKSDDPHEADTHIERLIQDVTMALGKNMDLGCDVETMVFTSVRADLGVIGMANYGLFNIEVTVTYRHEQNNP